MPQKTEQPRRRIGRPPNQGPDARPRKTSLMLHHEIREALETAAAKRGWSMSAEANMRLRKSLEDDVL